jgi:hypothetical protein
MTHTNPNEGCDRISDSSRLNTFLNAIYNSPQSGRSRIRIILIGTIEDVTQQIHRFRRSGLEVPQWSPPQRIPDSDEVVCVYIQNGGRSDDRM